MTLMPILEAMCNWGIVNRSDGSL
ncbi:hypothetical protein COL91_15585 [Bacillus pseudomycoides]|nr:hypothetical protein COO02_20550 [Bacillus pseudomycoides]PEI93765.1 hypothetical protein CN679_07215 [Bacillus pseudomycoides]PGA90238.1 hypothetical protein COL91_15585 [Bacillus pseudomycoides]PHF36695.1 hypothetical protein COF72_24250 [Bacillus pseudomycoides]